MSGKRNVLLILVLTFCRISLSLAAEDTWTTKTDMPTTRSYMYARVVERKIYVVGGL